MVVISFVSAFPVSAGIVYFMNVPSRYGWAMALYIFASAIVCNTIAHVKLVKPRAPFAAIEPPRRNGVTLDLKHADVTNEEGVSGMWIEFNSIDRARFRTALECARAAQAAAKKQADATERAEIREVLNRARANLTSAGACDDVMIATGPYGSTAKKPSALDGNGEIVREPSLEEQLDAVVPDCSIRGESKPNESGEHRISVMIREALARNAMPIISIGDTATADSAAA